MDNVLNHVEQTIFIPHQDAAAQQDLSKLANNVLKYAQQMPYSLEASVHVWLDIMLLAKNVYPFHHVEKINTLMANYAHA